MKRKIKLKKLKIKVQKKLFLVYNLGFDKDFDQTKCIELIYTNSSGINSVRVYV